MVGQLVSCWSEIDRGVSSEALREMKNVDDFGIDASQLEDVSAEDAFRLGVEWKMIFDELSGVQPFSAIVLSTNRERLESLAVRFGRPATFAWVNDDYLRMEVARANA